MTGSALILGPSGRFGFHAAQAFQSAGWQVHRFDRAHDDLRSAVRTVDVVVNGWNPAYPHWARDVPRFTGDLIEAIKGTETTVIIPGNVYVFGADTPEPWGPDTPHGAQNPLGLIRRQMEARYRAEGVRTIVLRGGDFLDTRASGNWFDKVMVKSLGKGAFTYPGDPDVVHTWAFLPDMARAAVALSERRMDLPVFCDVPFPGYALTARQIAARLGDICGTRVKVKRMAWLPLYLLAPVWPMARALIQMRYLWNVPHRLDRSTLDRLLPGFEQTPAEEALRFAVQGAGFSTRSTQTSRWRLAESTSS